MVRDKSHLVVRILVGVRASLRSHLRSADTGWTDRSTHEKEQSQDAGHWGLEVRASAFHPPGISVLSPSLPAPPSQPQLWNDLGCPTAQSSRGSWHLPRMGLGVSLKWGVLTRSVLHCLTFASLFLKTNVTEIIHTHTHTHTHTQAGAPRTSEGKKHQSRRDRKGTLVVLKVWSWNQFQGTPLWPEPGEHINMKIPGPYPKPTGIRMSRSPCLTSTLI